MKQYIKRNLEGFLIVVFLLVNQAVAQSQESVLKFGTEIRPRTEFRHGYNLPINSANEYAFFTSQRSRIFLGIEKSKVEVKLTGQDIRVWGSAPLQTLSDGHFSVYEAWAKYNFSPKLNIQLGRQELSLNDERVFGAANWNQQGRVHDGLNLNFKDSLNSFRMFLAFNQATEELNSIYYNVSGNYKTMQVLWYDRLFSFGNLSLLTSNIGWQSPLSKTATRNMQMFGNHFTIKPSEDAEIVQRFYYQSGRNANNDALAAYFAALDFNYKLNKNYKLGIGAEYLSGNSGVSSNSKNQAFTPIFGTNHKFNGNIDYFYVKNHLNSVGLLDSYLSASYANKSHFGLVRLHYFNSAEEFYRIPIIQEKAGKYLGTEIDLVYRYAVSNMMNLELGYSQILISENMKVLKGGNEKLTQNWAYLMLSFNPSLLLKL